MSTVNAEFRFSPQTNTYFTNNPTKVLADGEPILNTTTRTIYVGDGSTQLQNLQPWGAAAWGSITGTLSNQTDLQNALNAKQNTITTGTTAQYFRGDLSLATFPTNVSSFSNDAGYLTSAAIGVTVQGYSANTTLLGNSTTGSGSIVLATSPTFGTQITTPSIVVSGNISAASWTTSGIKYKGVASTLTNTTSSGTVVNTYTNVFGGNTIVSSSATTYTNYYASFFNVETAGSGSTITNNYAIGTNGGIRQIIGTGNIQLSALTTNPNVGVIYLNVTPSGTNYSLAHLSGITYLNSTSATQISVNTNLVAYYTSYSARWTGGNYSGAGVGDLCWWTAGSGTSLAASVEVNSYVYNSSTQQYNTGSLTNLRKVWIKPDTISFVGASTLTNSYSLFVEAATAGTNATITNNYAFGTNGKAKFGGNIELTQTVTTETVISDTTVTIVINGTTYKLLAKA